MNGRPNEPVEFHDLALRVKEKPAVRTLIALSVGVSALVFVFGACGVHISPANEVYAVNELDVAIGLRGAGLINGEWSWTPHDPWIVEPGEKAIVLSMSPLGRGATRYQAAITTPAGEPLCTIYFTREEAEAQQRVLHLNKDTCKP